MDSMPKSYLTNAEREGLTQNGVYLAESLAAGSAGDDEAAWEWLKYAEIPAYALMAMKKNQGADFIRRKGLRTETAEAVYGKNWLEAN
ncbi:hypothetical protein FACS1894158_04140 [Betaproteobacteria bacterium]|nr:hypothetical protein FACS1894158_04140 [Betaproteobacteria bacterium]GHU17603.1 hypothetical protein FACS189475_01690 [Betaproteobacteria bacterium]